MFLINANSTSGSSGIPDRKDIKIGGFADNSKTLSDYTEIIKANETEFYAKKSGNTVEKLDVNLKKVEGFSTSKFWETLKNETSHLGSFGLRYFIEGNKAYKNIFIGEDEKLLYADTDFWYKKPNEDAVFVSKKFNNVNNEYKQINLTGPCMVAFQSGNFEILTRPSDANVDIAKKLANLVGVPTNKITSMSSLLNNYEVVDLIAENDSAIDYILNSEVATKVIMNNEIAMQKVDEVEKIMTKILAILSGVSSTGYTNISGLVDNDNVMHSIANNPNLFKQIIKSDITVDTILANEGAMNILFDNKIIVNDVVNKKDVKAKVLGNEIALVKVVTKNAGLNIIQFSDLATISVNSGACDKIFKTKKIYSLLGSSSIYNTDDNLVTQIICTILNYNKSDYADFTAIAGNETAMTAIAGNETAMNAVLNSVAAMTAIAGSETAMNAVLASETAMEALLNNPIAMAAVAGSEIAVTVVLNSSTAMAAVLNSVAAMTAIANSEIAMNAVLANVTAMNAVVNSSIAMTAIADSETAMNAVLANETAINTVLANVTAMNAVVRNEISMKAIAGNETAMTAIADSETAMTAVINSSIAMTAIANSEIAMNAVINSNTVVINNLKAFQAIAGNETAMTAIADSETAMNAVLANVTAMNAIVNSETAMTAIADSETAMTAIADSETAMIRFGGNRSYFADSSTAMEIIAGSEIAMKTALNYQNIQDSMLASDYLQKYAWKMYQTISNNTHIFTRFYRGQDDNVNAMHHSSNQYNACIIFFNPGFYSNSEATCRMRHSNGQFTDWSNAAGKKPTSITSTTQVSFKGASGEEQGDGCAFVEIWKVI